ncbi:MAG TPA: GNAT family N-acetyltransferase [Alphaproteobacteria bacterium]
MIASATPWRIAPVDGAHAGLLAELHAHAFEAPWSAAALTELLALPGTFALLATAPGDAGEASSPIGFILCRVAGDECEVLTIAVGRAGRRRGAAKALLNAALAQAADRGAHAVYLEVAVDNAAARQLYAAAGFASVGRRRSYYQGAKDHPSTDALILMCALSPQRSTKA